MKGVDGKIHLVARIFVFLFVFLVLGLYVLSLIFNIIFSYKKRKFK